MQSVAGRTGMGAVMGSKNLKAVAVQGHGKAPVFDPAHYAVLRSEANRALRADAMTQVLHELGTSGAAEYFEYLGEMPKRYFHNGSFGEELRVSGAAVKESILTGVSDVDLAVRAMKLGAFDYLTKPVDDQNLLQVLENAIEHRTLRQKGRARGFVIHCIALRHADKKKR